jgi:hypothetical protein
MEKTQRFRGVGALREGKSRAARGGSCGLDRSAKCDFCRLSRIRDPRVNVIDVTHLRLFAARSCVAAAALPRLSPSPITKVKNVVCPVRPIWAYVRALHTNTE